MTAVSVLGSALLPVSLLLCGFVSAAWQVLSHIFSHCACSLSLLFVFD